MSKQKKQMAVKYKPLNSGLEADYQHERSLDLVLSPGCYAVEIDHVDADVGLPVGFCGYEHYIVGTLIVTDNGTKGTMQKERLTGQVLVVTLQTNHETQIFVRTKIGVGWSEWHSFAYAGMFDEISTTDELLSTVAELVTAVSTLEASVASNSDSISRGIARVTAAEQTNTELAKGILGGVLNSNGYIHASSGKAESNDDYRCSDFYNLSWNSRIVVKNGNAGNFSLLVAFYDKDKSFISGISNATEANISPDEFPNNAVYVRFSSRLPVDETLVSFVNIVEVANNVEDLEARLTESTVKVSSRIDSCENTIATVISKPMSLVVYGYYRGDGAYGNTENAKNTGLVYVGGYTKLRYSTLISSQAFAVCFFDSSRKLISGIFGTDSLNGGIVDLSDAAYSEVKYAAISYYDAKGVYEGYEALLYNEGSLESTVENLEGHVASLTTRTNSIEKIENEFHTALNPVTLITFPNVGYITKEGLLYGTDGYSRHSDKIPIKNILEIYSSAVIGVNVYTIIFYDKDGAVINGVEGTNATVGTLAFTEEQLMADSFRVQFYANNETMAKERSACYVTKYAKTPISVQVDSLETAVKELESTVNGNGLKVLVFGDSITTNADFSINENHQTTAYTFRENSNGYEDENGNWVSFSMWPFLMTKYLDCSDVRNYAQSGASYKESQRESGYERQNLSYQVQLALNDVANPNGAFPTVGNFVPDVIIFALGTNDGNPNDTYESAMEKTVMSADGNSFDVEATLGNLDVTKTCEAMRYAFLKVKQAFPQSLCLCVLPIQRANTENPGINDALEKMAKRYSIKIVDGYSELGVVRDLEVNGEMGANLKDGLHPNDKGQRLYTRMIVSAIKNNWIEM